MAGKPRRLVKRTLIILNLITALLFTLACIAPYLDPARWWTISFLGLGFSIILFALLAFLIFWLFFKPRYVFISLVAMILGWKSIAVLFAINTDETFVRSKPKSVIRVVHWNVARFIEWSRNNNAGSKKRLKMMDQLQAQNADVLCLVEFFHSTDSIYYDNLPYVMKKLGYPYYNFSWEGDGHKQWVGQAIFSRFPIVDSGVVRFPKPGIQETLIHADITRGSDTFRVFTTHLQSFQFKPEDYKRIQKIKNREDSLLENSRNIFSKLRRATVLRSQQANIVRWELDRSPHPFILTGDLNDVPNSYTYFIIREDLKDAFLEKGLGIGRTFNGLSPTLRIDYMFASKEFEVLQFNRIAKDLSDHYMLVADFQLTK
jgi:endonuclease/exonuclease/phosphatase family metal-dependent hydrolase